MVRPDSPTAVRLVEPKTATEPARTRLGVLEGLVRAIEDELSDVELTDEQRLQNIAERVAGVMDGR